MDLKEYILIFRKNIKLFLIVILLTVAAGILFQILRPISYKSYLTLNVTRTGIQETADYRYDEFYRLQADERFADTVVRWLGSARTVTDILNDAKEKSSGLSEWQLSKMFGAQRLSSQMIEVTYVTKDMNTAQSLGKSVIKIVNNAAQDLNAKQQEKNWFTIPDSDPVVKENKYSWSFTLLISLIIGAFMGFWAVLIKNYAQ